jgi:hypothetical protein
MKTTLILQEDCCAPDAKQVFYKEFEKLFGVSFDTWKQDLKNISKFEDTLIHETETYLAVTSAYNPYWSIYKKEKE